MSTAKLSRSIKCGQINAFKSTITLNSTGTPAVSGDDSNGVLSVVDLGVGHITIILKKPAQHNLSVIGSGNGSAVIVYQTASALDRVTVQIADMAGIATDAIVNLQISGVDNRLLY